MTLEAIVREQKPRARQPEYLEVVWCGRDEKLGLCPKLLDLGRGPSPESYYGASALAHAQRMGISAKSGMLTL